MSLVVQVFRGISYNFWEQLVLITQPRNIHAFLKTSWESVPQQKSVSLYNYVALPSVTKGTVSHKGQMSLCDHKGLYGIVCSFSAGVYVCVQDDKSLT